MKKETDTELAEKEVQKVQIEMDAKVKIAETTRIREENKEKLKTEAEIKKIHFLNS